MIERTITRQNANEVMTKIAKNIKELLREGLDIDIKCKVAGRGRSAAQNRLLMMWCSELAKHLNKQDGVSLEPYHVKQLMLSQTGRSISYYDMTFYDSTKSYTVKQMSEFLSDFEEECLTGYNLRLPPPSDLYHKAIYN